MPSRDDKPTRFKEWVQQAIPGASPEMRDALAKMVSPEMKQAFAELARRFQQPFQEAQDPPVAAPEPSAPAPSTPATTPEPSTPEAATPEPSAPEVPTAPLSASIPPASPPSSSAPSAPPASSPAPAPSTPRRLGQGPKLNEACRILREEFPPDGKPPPGTTYKAASERVNAKAKEPISDDVVADAVKLLCGNQRRR
jgi:hypothetical protein